MGSLLAAAVWPRLRDRDLFCERIFDLLGGCLIAAYRLMFRFMDFFSQTVQRSLWLQMPTIFCVAVPQDVLYHLFGDSIQPGTDGWVLAQRQRSNRRDRFRVAFVKPSTRHILGLEKLRIFVFTMIHQNNPSELVKRAVVCCKWLRWDDDGWCVAVGLPANSSQRKSFLCSI